MDCMRCVQVAQLQVGPEYNSHFSSLYTIFIGQLTPVLPAGADIPGAYTRGTDEDQAFVQNLALFFTAFYRVSFWGAQPDFGGVYVR